MKITAIKTRKVLPTDRGLKKFLDESTPRLRERSVVAITSKVAAILEGAVAPIKGTNTEKLIAGEADKWLPPSGKFNIALTIKNGILIPTAGIDESNSDGFYALWPSDPQKTANDARRHLMNRFGLRELGVIITDSSSRILRRGTFGIAIAHSGFRGLKDYVGKKDIFGRKLKMTMANHMESLATAAVLLMGEGGEQKPIAIIEDLPFVKFQKSNPSGAELTTMKIGLKEDIFAPLMKGVRWKKGGKGKSGNW
jgi:putative folate metabolism gamma-glutamate ligase